MLSGALYEPMDEELTRERQQARLLIKQFNDAGEDRAGERANTLRKLIPNAGEGLWVEPPFYCDYGNNIFLGEKVFFNFNCVVLDVMPVRIGSRTLIGPNVQIYTATHPMHYRERASGLEYARPVTIGEDVWIGGSAVICPGVHVGDHSVIGAGSVVTVDVPSDVFAAGNPCKVIRQLPK